jgi:hypothetical protein
MKIIFAHNSHNRPKTLKKSIEIEKTYFPESEYYVSITENGGIDESFFSDLENLKIIKTFGVGWQLGCVNCFYSVVSKACEEHDDGIIIFSHDDVYLKNYNVVKKTIKKMIDEDISFIVRQPKTFFGKNYYMMEVVYLRISHIRKNFTPFSDSLLSDSDLITKDINNVTSAEAWLHSKISDSKNGLIITYKHHGNTVELINQHLTDNLGYEHFNFGKHAWEE